MLRRIALLSAVLFALPSPALAGPSVFVNELHYDNSGPDTDEAIEIAGPALTNLTGWSVVLYNGTGGAAYETIPLSGYLSNQCDGFGTIVVSATGIQNGAPDGFALVNGTTVVQFLSYEGTFTVSNGPATGLTSTSIGVSENGGGPAGQSLRLAGIGILAEPQPPRLVLRSVRQPRAGCDFDRRGQRRVREHAVRPRGVFPQPALRLDAGERVVVRIRIDLGHRRRVLQRGRAVLQRQSELA